MKRQEWILLIVLAITVMASVLVGVGQVYITGMEGVRLKADQTLWLFFETAALFGISFLSYVWHRPSGCASFCCRL